MREYTIIKIALTIIICAFVCRTATSQSYQWANSVGGTGWDQGWTITTDLSDNVLVAGSFYNTVDFNPDSLVTDNLTSNGVDDIFFTKYGADGSYIWTKAIGGNGWDRCYSIVTDSFGNIYITGNFGGNVDFDPGSGTDNLSGNGNYDIFFAKYDSSGSLIWANGAGSSGYEIGYGIAVDQYGNVYVTGSFSNTVDFDPGSGTANLTSNGKNDIFFAKYDLNGNFIWVKNIGTSASDRGRGITIDTQGNLLIIGEFGFQSGGTADFDPGTGVADTANLTSNGADDIFFAKYDSSGGYLWAYNIGSTAQDLGTSITTDTADNVLITGYFNSSADFDVGAGSALLTANSGDIFLAKYDANGNYLWANNMGGTEYDHGYSIATD
ncbi:SBBP repeat-containing protein, partial [Cytophagaceae bacterium AH-315-L13]|nr:SBBP repeat-containing protein [Cytophagaceae bacterium AH-315-L13]